MTDNERLQDLSIEHQLDLIQYANSVVREEVGALNDSDDEMLAALLMILMSMPADADVATIDARLGPVLQLNAQAYRTIETDLRSEMARLAEEEAALQAAALRSATSPPGAVDGGNAALIAAEMLATPFMGVLVGEALGGLATARATAIRGAVRSGVQAGQTAEQIIRTIRGTAAARFADGLLNTARNHLETTIRTALTHAAEYVSAAVYALNPDIVKAVVWLSVLDSATSSWCIARAGKRYTADASHKPIGHAYDWGAGPGRYHFNCRSTSAPLVSGEVPDANTFASWLKKQPARVQDDVLGPTRGRMYRAGQVGVEGFLNNKGKLLTLDQLKARNAGIPAKYFPP